jgi:LmbE family N-acetylglucosaminyl deacetylase
MEYKSLLMWIPESAFTPAAIRSEACSLSGPQLNIDARPTSSAVRSDSESGEGSLGVFPLILAAAATLLFVSVTAAAQDSPRTLVAVFAHADDEGPAGPVLARYAREGVNVYLVIATDGAQGGMHTSIPRGPELARVRSEEARCAADALGIHPPILLGFPDAHLGSYTDDPARLFRLAERLQEQLARLRPDALITWGPDGATGHPDHRLIGSLVTQLVRAGAPGASEHLFYASIPIEGLRAMSPSRSEPEFLVPQPKYLSTRVAFTPADLEAARRSTACHRTQYSDEMLRRLAEEQSRLGNAALSFAPYFQADGGGDLFHPR